MTSPFWEILLFTCVWSGEVDAWPSIKLIALVEQDTVVVFNINLISRTSDAAVQAAVCRQLNDHVVGAARRESVGSGILAVGNIRSDFDKAYRHCSRRRGSGGGQSARVPSHQSTREVPTAQGTELLWRRPLPGLCCARGEINYCPRTDAADRAACS
jgi:hypothetical protein